MAPDSLPIKLRQARGSMTLSEAAERAGIPESRIREYEDGRRQPYAKTLKKLAAAYDCTVSELINSSGKALSVRRAPSRRRMEGGNGGDPGVRAPIVVEPGKEIRLVIEVILRAPANADAKPGTAPELSPDPTRTEGTGVTAEITQPVQESGSLPEPGRARRRRIPVRRVASKDADALVEFRRAYREFRERR